ncbi:MAG: hypothetical protein ACRETB_03665 [Steroidobacteraceae bacterium]
MGKRVAPPPPVLDALAQIFGAEPASVAQVKVVEHSLLALLHLRAVAATRRRRIYLRDGAAEFFADPVLMLHEYCHVLLQWETGTLTPWRYLRECLRHGYWRNRYEIEARACAERHHLRLRRLLGRDSRDA